MLVVGLTGGIGSGKSTVAARFAELGAPVIDTDLIAREVVAPGSAGLAAIRDAFGTRYLCADGTLDRARLRDRVFQDPATRQQLEALLHPLIRAVADARLAACDAAYAILVVPLLLEGGYRPRVDRILVVDIDPSEQRRRVLARDRMPPATLDGILAAQLGRERRLAAADDVVDNNGTAAATRSQVDALHARYLRLGTGPAAD